MSYYTGVSLSLSLSLILSVSLSLYLCVCPRETFSVTDSKIDSRLPVCDLQSQGEGERNPY